MKIKSILLSIALSVPMLMTAQPTVMEAGAHGYLERGKSMYNIHNYVGAIDQLTQAERLGLTGTAQEEAEYYIALCKFERAERSDLDALIDFIENHPTSGLAQWAQIKVGDYHFYRGDWNNALLSYSLVRDGALDGDRQEDLVYRRAYSNLRLGNYERAGMQYNMLASSKRYGKATIFYHAYIDYANGKYDTAMKKFIDIASALQAGNDLAYQAQYYITQIRFHNKEYNRVISGGQQLLSEAENDYFTAELNRIVGESYYHTGNNELARKHLTTYLNDPQGEPYRTAGYSMGVLDFKAADYAQAIQHMSIATEEDDALAQSAFLYIGQSRLKLNDVNGAARAFEQAAKMTHDNSVRETAFYNYAISQSQGARTPFDKSIDMFEQFLNDYPTSKYKDEVEGHLVDSYMSTTDYNRALKSINHIKVPGNKVKKAKQYVLYNMGVQSLSNNKTKEAISYLKEAVDLGNLDKTVYNESRLWLAEAQYRDGDFKNASANQQAYVKQAGKSVDNYGIAQYNLGYSLYQQGKYAEALTAFKNAAESKQLDDQMMGDTYNRMGDTYYYTQDYTQAQESYAHAMEVDKTAPRDYSMYQMGIMMALNKQFEQAISQMDLLIKECPTSTLIPQAILEKGNAYAALNNGKEAVATYKTLVKDYPKNAEARKALIQMAIVDKNLNNIDAAIDAYKQVIKNYPTSDEAQAAAEDMKLIYADRGELAQFEKFLNSVPGGPRIDVSEFDRLTFEAAEKAAINDNPSITRMQDYLKNNPNGAYVAKAKYYIARYNYFKGNYKDALNGINEALKAGNDASFAEDALSMRSDILMRQGKYDDALKAYDELAEKASSEDNRTMAQLGAMRASKALGKWKDVKEAATALLDKGGLNAAEEREVTMNRAMANANLGNKAEAQKDFSELAKDTQSEQGAQSSYELANMQYQAGDVKEAEKTINSFIDAGTPHSYWLAKSFILLSDIYAKQGRAADARDYLLSLKSNYPGNEKDILDGIESRLKSLKNATNSTKSRSKKK